MGVTFTNNSNNTYVPIATQTVGTPVASITFSSISQAYTDLIVVVNAGASTGTGTIWLRFNGDTGSNYSWTSLYGNGTAASSTRGTTQAFGALGDQITSTGNTHVYIPNYTNTTLNKTYISRGNSVTTGTSVNVGRWAPATPAAISSIVISSNTGGNFIANSVFTIYGILAA